MNTHKPSRNQFRFLAAPILGHHIGPHTKLPPQISASIPQSFGHQDSRWTYKDSWEKTTSIRQKSNLFPLCLTIISEGLWCAVERVHERLRLKGKEQEIIIFSSSFSAVTPLDGDDLEPTSALKNITAG